MLQEQESLILKVTTHTQDLDKAKIILVKDGETPERGISI